MMTQPQPLQGISVTLPIQSETMVQNVDNTQNQFLPAPQINWGQVQVPQVQMAPPPGITGQSLEMPAPTSETLVPTEMRPPMPVRMDPAPSTRPYGIAEEVWQQTVQANLQQPRPPPGLLPPNLPRVASMTECVGLPTYDVQPLNPADALGADVTASSRERTAVNIRTIPENVNLICLMETLAKSCTPLSVMPEGLDETQTQHYSSGNAQVGQPTPFEKLLKEGDCCRVPVDNDMRASRAQQCMSSFEDLHPDNIALMNAYTGIAIGDMVQMSIHCTTKRLQLEAARVAYLEGKLKECSEKVNEAINSKYRLMTLENRVKELETQLAQEGIKTKALLDQKESEKNGWIQKYNEMGSNNLRYKQCNEQLGKENLQLKSDLERLNEKLQQLSLTGAAAPEREVAMAQRQAAVEPSAGLLPREQGPGSLMDKLDVIKDWSTDFKNQVIVQLGAINPERVGNPDPDQIIRRFTSMPTCIISMTPKFIYFDQIPTNHGQLLTWKYNMEERIEKWTLGEIENMTKAYK